jgi:hypothetical protein
MRAFIVSIFQYTCISNKTQRYTLYLYLEASRIGAPYIYSISHLMVKCRIKSHLPFANITSRFNFYGSVHCKYIPIYIQQDTTLQSLFISGNCYTCFGWYFHPSSGAHTTVSTASGICHTVTAICRYRGKVGTGVECAVGGVRHLQHTNGT